MLGDCLATNKKLSGSVAHIQVQAGEIHVPYLPHIAMNEWESNQKKVSTKLRNK